MNDEAFCKHNVQIDRNNFLSYFYNLGYCLCPCVSEVHWNQRKEESNEFIQSCGKRKRHPLFILLFYISGMKNNLV